MTRAQIKDMLATFLGGHTAEKLVFNEVTTGGYDDIKRATELARRMVTEYGMSDRLGPRTFGDKQEMVFLGREISEQKDYGDKIADAIDEEVSKIIRNAHKVAKKILTENKPKLIYVAQKLIVHETLEGEELDALLTQPAPSLVPEVATTPTPTPAKATTKTKRMPKKAPITPRPFPKQAPAAPEIA